MIGLAISQEILFHFHVIKGQCCTAQFVSDYAELVLDKNIL